MKSTNTIKINFKGGIISPGDLYNILVAARKSGVLYVRFGLRQQLLFDVAAEEVRNITDELDLLGFSFETNKDDFPNIVSSYPAEEIFINHTWLSEGVYKDIFDLVDYQPKLKINVSDSNQSFTPMLTGNINWVASPTAQHFWHLFIRFPKTNVIYEWKEIVYTNDVARMSQKIETLIWANPEKFIDNPDASGDELYAMIPAEDHITKPAEEKLKLPAFNLPYYEGLNRYHDKSWLGIYRRDELFSVDFLRDVCTLCLQTKVGQLCSTPWKSIIIKGIEEKDRSLWNYLLARYQINVRHAANELNFQVEDNCKEGLALKNYLVKHLSNEDTRTFGICLGIKIRSKSEVFSSVLIRRRPLFRIGKWGFFHFYDILCAKDFNPNERTGFIFSRYNTKFLLPEQLRRVILAFYAHQAKILRQPKNAAIKKETVIKTDKKEYVHQCKHCLSIYDETIGEPANGIAAGTPFEGLPEGYTCSLCEAPVDDIIKIEKAALGLQPV
ncbi:MAG TPA: rubredoxin [Chitinophagaceae bacterium]